jgi:uncharacterized FAD-dependent dehydrogenase
MIRLTGVHLPLHAVDAGDHSASDRPPEEDGIALRKAVAKKLGIELETVERLHVVRRTPDARKRSAIKLVYTVDVELSGSTPEAELLTRFEHDPTVLATPDTRYQPVASSSGQEAHRPVVIGLGPCGLFAGLILAEMGFRPLILERGKEVRKRTVDTFALWRKRQLDPESNVQFGEGGAGTFSDGKLYSQVRDRKHHGRKVLREFVEAGAPKDILWQGRPHIGTFRLVKMVETMRHKIEGLGGEIRFETRVTDLAVEERDGRRTVRGLRLATGEELRADAVVLAVGHSARDTFEMLHQRGVAIERKPFSIGFRVEHPQSMIDQQRYGRNAGHPALGAADYRLRHHCRGPGLSGRTVYSFCMCPGGTVVAATSEVGRVVTNGMSQYDRSERNANAGLVVDLTADDFGGDPSNPLAGIELQRAIESRAFEIAGSNYNAPGQLVSDFLAGRASTSLGRVEPSYTPGVTLTDLAELMPDFVLRGIREALPQFESKMPGFCRDDAVLTGVETRTSSPIRISRDEELQSTNTRGLFPAGEGAGFAGGILSAAIDGIRIAEAVSLMVTKQTPDIAQLG